jgi:hypothetical protein
VRVPVAELLLPVAVEVAERSVALARVENLASSVLEDVVEPDDGIVGDLQGRLLSVAR